MIITYNQITYCIFKVDMLRSSHIIAIGGLILVSRMWIDICELWKHQIKMNTYTKISSCLLDVMTIIQQESKRRDKKIK